jgi:hypothetical protein
MCRATAILSRATTAAFRLSKRPRDTQPGEGNVLRTWSPVKPGRAPAGARYDSPRACPWVAGHPPRSAPAGAAYITALLCSAHTRVPTATRHLAHRGCVKALAGTCTQPLQGCSGGGSPTQGSTCGAIPGFGMQPLGVVHTTQIRMPRGVTSGQDSCTRPAAIFPGQQCIPAGILANAGGFEYTC